jgi:hypothetical protein
MIRILLEVDEEHIGQLYSEELYGEGYEVFIFVSGHDLWERSTL